MHSHVSHTPWALAQCTCHVSQDSLCRELLIHVTPKLGLNHPKKVNFQLLHALLGCHTKFGGLHPTCVSRVLSVFIKFRHLF